MDWFLISLSITGIITRFFAHKYHIVGKDLKKQKTLIGYIRRNLKFSFELHHIHFGLLLLLFLLIWFLIFNNLSLILFGISLSLIVDQWIPLIFRDICYFSKLGILSSLLGHLAIIGIYLTFIL